MGKPGPKARAIPERFWAKVEKGDGCWLWQGKRNYNGYGIFTIHRDGHTTGVGAHRMAYELSIGNADGLYVLHRCDNPSCVNPAHLFLGDQTENMADASRKGRLVREPLPPAAECERGHPMSGDNLYVWRGQRHCRACRALAENKRRGKPRRPPKPARAECRKGHAYTPENTYLFNGHRYCRACRTEQDRARRHPGTRANNL